jgi:hypothetical protein
MGVRVNQRRDDVSPVVRQSLARLIRLRSKLTRRPAPGFCLYDSAHGGIFTAKIIFCGEI